MDIQGFYISDCTNGLKQHLNLSANAWITLYSDLYEFDPEKLSVSGVLNRILKNFYQEADASISLKTEKKRQEIEDLFTSDEFTFESNESKKIYEDKLLEQYSQGLKDKAFSYPKGLGQKFRINNSNIKLLRELKEADYYKVIGSYLKSLFEEYALLPHYRREQVYFKDTMDTVLHALQDRSQLKIVVQEKRKDYPNFSVPAHYYVSPLKIVQDSTISFNYLVGYGEKQSSSAELSLLGKEKVPVSFEIGKISSISEVRSMTGFISKEKEELLLSLLRERTASFLDQERIHIRAALTAKGLDMFYSQLYLRPLDYDMSSKGPDGSVVLSFTCSEEQALAYFFRFGKEAEIQSPVSLREEFAKRYQEAAELYHS
jgi:hypothetical protein